MSRIIYLTRIQPLVNPGAPGGSSPPDKVFNFTFGAGSTNGAIWVNGVLHLPPVLQLISNTADQWCSIFASFRPDPLEYPRERHHN